MSTFKNVITDNIIIQDENLTKKLLNLNKYARFSTGVTDYLLFSGNNIINLNTLIEDSLTVRNEEIVVLNDDGSFTSNIDCLVQINAVFSGASDSSNPNDIRTWIQMEINNITVQFSIIYGYYVTNHFNYIANLSKGNKIEFRTFINSFHLNSGGIGPSFVEFLVLNEY